MNYGSLIGEKVMLPKHRLFCLPQKQNQRMKVQIPMIRIRAVKVREKEEDIAEPVETERQQIQNRRRLLKIKKIQ